MNRHAALEILRRAEPALRSRYGVVSAHLFGSLARDEGDELSDIDVAVRFERDQGPDVMKLCGVSGLLSSLFEADVDVIALPARDPGLDAMVRDTASDLANFPRR